MILRLIALVALSAAVSLPSASYLLQNKNPNCPGVNAASHKNNLYDFSYDSWVKKADKGDLFMFGRCVQTNNNTIVYIDWPKAELKGYAKPGRACQHEVPSQTDDSVLDKGDLYYGARPEKIVAPFKAVKLQMQTKTPALHSYVRMSVPKIDTTEVKNPEDLRDIDAEFVSSVAKVGKEKVRYEYTYSWGPADKDKASLHASIAMKWKSEAVNRAMADSKMKGPAKLSTKAATATLVSEYPPEYVITSVEFLDVGEKSPVGRSSVAIYQPASPKKKD